MSNTEKNFLIKYEGSQITMFSDGKNDYINITEMAKAWKYRKSIVKWLRNKQTIDFYWAFGNPGVGNFLDAVTICNTTGISDIENNISVSVFPNPVSTQTILQTDLPDGRQAILHNATLTVDNCFGQTVAQIKNINGQIITFKRENLPSGLYFYKVTGDKGQGTSEVIATGKLIITD